MVSLQSREPQVWRAFGLLGFLILVVSGAQMEGCPVAEDCPTTPTGSPTEVFVRAGEAGRIEAAACDPDRDLLLFQWSIDESCGFEDTAFPESNTGPILEFTPPNACATCTVTVTVFDGRGGFAIGNVTVDMAPETAIPVLVCDPTPVKFGGQVCCDASGTVDPDGDPATALVFTWIPPSGVPAPDPPDTTVFCFDTGQIETLEVGLEVVHLCVQDPDPPATSTMEIVEVVECTDDADCDDENDCTDDTCDGNVCVSTPNDANCPDDGVTCTDELCTDEGCISTPNDANCPDDGLFCNGTEFCDAVDDCSSAGDPCPSGTICNESGNTCDTPQVDQPGTCGNEVVDIGEQCDDGNTANGDCCSSTCQFEKVGSPCCDGDACTIQDTCDDGECIPGSPAALSCTDC